MTFFPSAVESNDAIVSAEAEDRAFVWPVRALPAATCAARFDKNSHERVVLARVLPVVRQATSALCRRR